LEIFTQMMTTLYNLGDEIHECEAVQEYQRSGRGDEIQATDLCSTEKVTQLTIKYKIDFKLLVWSLYCICLQINIWRYQQCMEDANLDMTRKMIGHQTNYELAFDALCEGILQVKLLNYYFRGKESLGWSQKPQRVEGMGIRTRKTQAVTTRVTVEVKKKRISWYFKRLRAQDAVLFILLYHRDTLFSLNTIQFAPGCLKTMCYTVSFFWLRRIDVRGRLLVSQSINIPEDIHTNNFFFI